MRRFQTRITQKLTGEEIRRNLGNLYPNSNCGCRVSKLQQLEGAKFYDFASKLKVVNDLLTFTRIRIYEPHEQLLYYDKVL